MVVTISTDIAKWENTQADIQVRDGDVLVIPKEPSLISVEGQVYSPSALSYFPGRKADWYLRHAGGPTRMANLRDAFIIRANGSVVGRQGKFGGSVLSIKMQPGDSIVVPEKIVGAPFWKTLLDSAQIMSSAAIMAALAAKI